ncbi:MAG: glycosyltransferase family 39 protein [Qipengyuania sp.]|nr:glycosyltransferase family 39 protein [Qipengyuania sp.]
MASRLLVETSDLCFRSKVSTSTKERTVLIALVVISIALVTIERLWIGLSIPLWLDETWTVMIASQPDWPRFWHEAWLDVNPPLYYAFMKVWIAVAGDSNMALRLPSFIFYYLAAAIPLIWKEHGLPRQAALAWSALILLWNPGIAMTLDARAYGLLVLICMCLALAFIRAWKTCASWNLLLWSGLGAAAILTHYFAGFLVTTQGLMLLWRWRLQLARRAHALAPLGLAAAWITYHLPRIRDYARPDVVWYDPISWQEVLRYAIFTFGGLNPMFAILLVLALGGALWISNWEFGGTKLAVGRVHRHTPEIEPIHVAFVSAALSLVFILLISSASASLTERYLVPLVPLMLLGVVLVSLSIGRSNLALSLVVFAYAAVAINPTGYLESLEERSFYGYETPSNFVAQAQPTDLVFVWDHPAAKILDRGSLQQIGGYFLNRAGLDVNTNALILSKSENPNVAIRAAVKNDRTAIIWLYDAQHRSAAARFPPKLDGRPPWDCSDQRSYTQRNKKWRLAVGRIACVQSPKGE